MIPQISPRILLVEDEPALVLLLTDLFRAEGYEVDSVSDGEAGLSKALTRQHSVIVLDVMLPKKSGFDVCKELRQAGVDTAILMLTAKTLVGDRVAGLRLGADDYLAKPFDPSELLARIEALLRRVEKRRRAPLKSFSFEDVAIDFEQAEVQRAGQRVALASKEFQLLEYLVLHRDRVLPREEILQKVWQYDSEVNSRTVDVHIAWLRQKLDHPQNPKHIQTVRGRGYKFTS
ncbi:MAG TPA: response regulator transcription factor [Candidatus Acidoferrum sp.]|nr:response regulator transcription factor [Candidatus Acidoferrum sp.]